MNNNISIQNIWMIKNKKHVEGLKIVWYQSEKNITIIDIKKTKYLDIILYKNIIK